MRNKTYVYITNPCNLNTVFCIVFKRGEFKKIENRGKFSVRKSNKCITEKIVATQHTPSLSHTLGWSLLYFEKC
jgi:hypothetical protein